MTEVDRWSFLSGDGGVPGQEDVEEENGVYAKKSLLLASLLVRFFQHVAHHYYAGYQGPDEAEQDQQQVYEGGGWVG